MLILFADTEVASGIYKKEIRNLYMPFANLGLCNQRPFARYGAKKKHDEAINEWEKGWAKYSDVIVIMYLKGLEI